MSNITLWSTTAASNNSAAPNGFPEGMSPSTVNDACREVMAAVRRLMEDNGWFNWGHTYTYVSSTSFSVPTNLTAIYSVGRRVRAAGSGTGTIYGTISTSTYTSITTVVVVWDSGSLSNETLAISLSYLTVNSGIGISDLVKDTTPQLGGDLDVNGHTIQLGESSFQLDPAISADGKWSGITETGIAGDTLVFGDVCYYAVADSRWELAKADVVATSGGVKLGICVLAAANNGSATEMLLYGKINAAGKFPALTIGAPCYLSETTAGSIVVGAVGDNTGQPDGTDEVIRVVGKANSGDELFFCPDNFYMTHT